jgi:hypothetical protein
MQTSTPITNPTALSHAFEPHASAVDGNDSTLPVAELTSAAARDINRGVQRHRTLIGNVLRHTEQLVQQPCRTPVMEIEYENMASTYSNCWVYPAAYPRVERGCLLQLRLEGDILPTTAQYQGLGLARVASLLDELGRKLDTIRERLHLSDVLLDGLRELSELMFRHLSLSSSSTTELRMEMPGNLRDAFLSIKIQLPSLATPLEVYALVAERWCQIEHDIVEFQIEALKIQLERQRLGLYLTTAHYLAKEAADLLLNQIDDDDAIGPDDFNPARSTLQECMEDPFLGRWPSPSGQRLGTQGAALTP